jgi:hypothetical protein
MSPGGSGVAVHTCRSRHRLDLARERNSAMREARQTERGSSRGTRYRPPSPDQTQQKICVEKCAGTLRGCIRPLCPRRSALSEHPTRFRAWSTRSVDHARNDARLRDSVSDARPVAESVVAAHGDHHDHRPASAQSRTPSSLAHRSTSSGR